MFYLSLKLFKYEISLLFLKCDKLIVFCDLMNMLLKKFWYGLKLKFFFYMVVLFVLSKFMIGNLWFSMNW